jgi:hypothetical protein
VLESLDILSRPAIKIFQERVDMRKSHSFFLLLCLPIFLILSACAPNVFITPDLPIVPHNDFTLGGKIDYDGNVEYLPRTISSGSHPGATLTLRYRYEVTYGRDSIEQVLYHYNPLTIAGFPIGADTVVVIAKLEVVKGSSQIETYTAMCVLDKHRTIFWEGESLSELRKRGLLAVRENIEAQMYGDRDVLLKAAREN